MSDRPSNTDLARNVADLARTLEALQDELATPDRRRLGLPSPRDLLRFTSEVTIPATILVLETNVRVLRLLQRTIRTTSPESDATRDEGAAVRDRATALGRDALDGLDATLADLESALQGRPADGDAASLLEEARRLSTEVDAELAADRQGPTAVADSPTAGIEDSLGKSDPGHAGGGDPVEIDVEAELQSIKDDLDDDGEGGQDEGGL